MYPSNPLSAAQRADLHTRARRQAQLARQAAVSGFWHSVFDHAASALRVPLHALHSVGAATAATAAPAGDHKTSGV